jgi:hypothetical protein
MKPLRISGLKIYAIITLEQECQPHIMKMAAIWDVASCSTIAPFRGQPIVRNLHTPKFNPILFYISYNDNKTTQDQDQVITRP